MRLQTHRPRVAALAMTVAVGGALALPGLSPAVAAPAVTVDRLAGVDRYDTAAALARAAFPGGASTAVIASGVSFPDALTASALAGQLGAPILLTAPDALPAATRAALTALGVTRVVVVGGERAVGSAVTAALSAYSPSRVAGFTRYETARRVVEAIGAAQVGRLDGARTVFVATGETFPDALAAGSPAYSSTLPVVLTTPDALPSEAAQAITAAGATSVVVLGGTGAVSDAVVTSIQQLPGVQAVRRIAGTDRYATAARLADLVAGTTPQPPRAVALARGDGFADALAGGPQAARLGAPILLTLPDALPEPTSTWLAGHTGVTQVVAYGGTDAVGDEVLAAAAAAVGGEPSGAGSPAPNPTTSSSPAPNPTTSSSPAPNPTASSSPAPNPTASSSPTPNPTTAPGPVAVSGSDSARLGLADPRLVFSTVAGAATPPRNVTLTNTGADPVTVDLAASGPDATSFALAPGQPSRLTLAAGETTTVSVVFTPTPAAGCPGPGAPDAIGDVERLATLTVTPVGGQPASAVTLAGVNACNNEGKNEPVLGQIFRTLGYTTQATDGNDVRFIGPKRFPASADERQLPYLVAADPSMPVSVEPLAHYSGRDTTSSGYGRVGYFAAGAPVSTPCSRSVCTELFRFPGDSSSSYAENQKLLPKPIGTTTFRPSGVFGLFQGENYSVTFSDDAFNVALDQQRNPIDPPHYLHNLRFYQAYGANRTEIANTYLVAVDVTNIPANKNNDYQDVVLLVRNVAPAVLSGPVPGSAALQHDLTTGGTVSPDCAVTGFDGVLPNGNNTQCNAGNIAFTNAGLALTATAGQLGGSGNRQQNALYDLFDASKRPFTIRARVAGPVDYLTDNYQQVAAFFGPDQDNYVKVEVEHNGAGADPHVTMFFEENGAGGTVATVSVPALTSANTVDLLISGSTSVPDPSAPAAGYPLDEVTVAYSINGGPAVPVGAVRRPADVMRWFATAAKAGLLVSGGNSPKAFTATFTRFDVLAG